jgi:hypothetical protein
VKKIGRWERRITVTGEKEEEGGRGRGGREEENNMFSFDK